ncbi:DoxX family protein [Catellatospora sp. KI3]|uniref:DoxX family protein n=1 Tax=Catellatospora sp. KI3 TaxID=3041620 RepID=UPI00248301B9|nr:DoxX family protein [Catellatospora sp. KI3]MDI1459527.1 DoxX family protein [Catellatospora sp. KI3]
MNIALWIVQILLGLAFLAAGLLKATQPKEALRAKNLNWVDDYSAGMVKLIGVSEILGGIGLIAPWATGIAPVLTPIAAVALAAVMVGAALAHLRRKEYPAIVFNIVLAALAVFVAVGRF